MTRVPRAAVKPGGVFVLSLDLELAWGSWRRTDIPAQAFAGGAHYARRLDAIARERRLAFTYAVVGSLAGLTLGMLEAADPDDGVDTLFPGLGPYAQGLPSVRQVRASPECWLAADLVDELRTSPAGHDIGSHSFFHVTPATRAAMANDVTACADAVMGGQPVASYIFPRDAIAEVAGLGDAGVRIYRGPVEAWYRRRQGTPHGLADRIAHTLVQAAGCPTSLAHVRAGSPAEITSSGILTLRTGVRRRIPLAALRRRFLRPLERAAATGGIYHLWTHPWNLALPGSDAFELLAEVLHRAADLRDRGDLEVATMRDLAARGA